MFSNNFSHNPIRLLKHKDTFIAVNSGITFLMFSELHIKHVCDFLNESILHLEIKTDTHYDSPKPRRGVTKTNPCVLTGPRPVQCCELSQHQAATGATPAHVASGETIVWGDNTATHPQ